MDKTKATTPVKETPKNLPVESNLDAQAKKGYPIMRNIMYQTAKEIAVDIGGIVPRLLEDIELPEYQSRYTIAKNICIYQFRLSKANPRIQYTLADLEEFRGLFQATVSRLINSGNFPTIQMQSYLDVYGNWHDAVCIDIIEDIGNIFIIHAVFINPEYAEYLHELQLEKQSMSTGSTVPDASWDI